MFIRDFFELLYPEVCYACGKGLVKGEKHICTFCRHTLPKTNFHLIRGNPVEKMFWGRVPLRAATSMYYFSKGSGVQNLIHQLKYMGKKEIGDTLGVMMGNALSEAGLFNDVDLVIPVPLHRLKALKRGYNQCDPIAAALAKRLGAVSMTDNLIRKKESSTQTRKARYQRWQNVSDIFYLHRPEAIRNKKILLVDDVVTTGSTLEACACTLLKVRNVELCIATVACA